MRITGGQYRGRTLITPPDDKIRPTADKTRLAVFNMLESRGLVRDAVVIDVFCGTGALGIEAISRGAVSCTFVDQSPVAITLARRNASALACDSQCTFMSTDARQMTACPVYTKPATLVFMDPPYRQDLVLPTLDALEQGNWVDLDRVVYMIETEKEWVPSWPPGMTTIQTRTYGITSIHFITRKTPEND